MTDIIFKEFDIFNFLSMMENHYVGFTESYKQDNNNGYAQTKSRLKKKMLQYIKNPTNDYDLSTKLLVSMYKLYCENKSLKMSVNHSLGLGNLQIQPKLVDVQTEEVKSFQIETKDTPKVVKKEVVVIPPTKEYIEKYEFLLMYDDIEHPLDLKLTADDTCEVLIQTASDHPHKTKVIKKGDKKGKEIPAKVFHNECIGYAYFKHKSQVARNHQPNVVGDILYFDDVPALFICINKDPENTPLSVIPRKKYQSYKIVDNNMQSLDKEVPDEGIYIYEL